VNSLLEIFSPSLVEAAKAHALEAAAKGEECCGAVILAPNDLDLEYVPLLNCAEDPSQEFKLDPDEWYSVELETVSIFHSHHLDTQPGTLTPADIASARDYGYPTLLYHTTFGCWDYWDPDYWYPWPLQDHARSYPKVSDFLGWAFEYGRADCWSLARAWFDRVHSIRVPDYPRGEIEELDDGAFDPFMRSYPRFGFTRVDGPIQDCDLLILRIGRYPTHCAIVTDADKGTAIHHLGQSLLSTEFQVEQWQAKIHAILRHQELC
jgi:NlpC/P60 family